MQDRIKAFTNQTISQMVLNKYKPVPNSESMIWLKGGKQNQWGMKDISLGLINIPQGQCKAINPAPKSPSDRSPLP